MRKPDYPSVSIGLPLGGLTPLFSEVRPGFALTGPRPYPMLPSPMQAGLISIGTELLLGEILDTNAQYLAARLPPLGIDLYYMSKVGDNLERLAEGSGRRPRTWSAPSASSPLAAASRCRNAM